MSNTTAVFQKSYQAEHVRVNLLKTRFKSVYPDAGLWDDGLERAMRTMTLRRDPNAPSAPSPEDLQSIELRRDVSDLRERLRMAQAASSDRMTWNALLMRVRYLVEHLSDLVVKVRRKEYFERVDRQRALGQSTLETAAPASVIGKAHVQGKLCHGGEALNEVAGFLRRYSYSADRIPAAEQERWLALLLGYLTNNPAVAKTEGTDEREVGDCAGSDGPVQGQTGRICFLCRGRFASGYALTTHCTKMHVNKGTFNQPFPCPECRRRGNPDCTINDVSSWSGHVETLHGDENAPKLRTQSHSILDKTKLCCPFCGLYLVIRGFHRHRKSHVGAGAASAVFSSPFSCLACQNGSPDKDQSIVIDGCSAWNAHVSSAHSDAPGNWSVGDLGGPKKASMCLLCDRPFSSRSTLTAHCKTMHVEKGTFSQPFPCPRCLPTQSELPDQFITSASSWSIHVETVHGLDHAPNLRTDPTINGARSRCPFCGICLQQNGFYAHFRSHLRDGPTSAIFSTTFSCLCCSGDGPASYGEQSVVIDGCSVWDAHVLAAHREVARTWTVGDSATVRKRKRQVEVGHVTTARSRECPYPETALPLQGLEILPIDPRLLEEDRRRKT